MDIDLRILGPDGELIYSGLQFESSSYTFSTTKAGTYQICWNNEMARWTAKVVQFDIQVGEQKQTKDDLLTKDTLTPMDQSVERLTSALDQIQKDQQYLRVREQAHRDTAESTNARVLWYSVVESVILISISLGQVYYLRKFFETKRTV